MSVNRRAVLGSSYAFGLGLIAGGIEAVAVASRATLPLSWLEFMLAGLVAMLSMGVFAGLIAALIALPVHFAMNQARPSTALSVHQAFVGSLLIGFYLWQAAWLVYTDERAPGAVALAAMPLGFAGVIYYNARFMLRRVEAGKPIGWPWGRSAGLIGVGFVMVAATLYSFRDTGGNHALPDDQNLLVISVENWHYDEPVGIEGGAAFTNAVTPNGWSRSAAATLQTGIHPLRTEVLFPGDRLGWNYRTIAEVLSVEGYATAAFVGNPDLAASSGLDQGFKVYDDDMSPVLPGLLRFNLLQHVLGGSRSPRADAEVVQSFTSWLNDKRALPFYAWVHLRDTHPEELLPLIESVKDETMVVLVGTSGDETMSIYDRTVRVPLAARFPGKPLKHETIDAQVRLMDIAAAAYDFLGMEGPETEGLNLAGYVSGDRTQTLGCTLVGTSPDGPVIGVRNNGMKFMELPEGTLLFDVDKDASESDDLSARAADSLESARRLIASDSIRFEKLMAR